LKSKAKFHDSGLVLDAALAAKNNDACFKSSQNQLKNNHLDSLILIRARLCTLCAFHRIGKAKLGYFGLVFGSSPFSIQFQLHPKIMLALKVQRPSLFAGC
jgi:hypothetical protein